MTKMYRLSSTLQLATSVSFNTVFFLLTARTAYTKTVLNETEVTNYDIDDSRYILAVLCYRTYRGVILA
jgi:hypothetical protein